MMVVCVRRNCAACSVLLPTFAETSGRREQQPLHLQDALSADKLALQRPQRCGAARSRLRHGHGSDPVAVHAETEKAPFWPA
jgi:hypothetical protein